MAIWVLTNPLLPLGGETWVTQMNTELEERIRRETNTPPEKELGGATLGIRNIMQARKIVLVAKGANKADIVRKMLEGPVTPEVPCIGTSSFTRIANFFYLIHDTMTQQEKQVNYMGPFITMVFPVLHCRFPHYCQYSVRGPLKEHSLPKWGGLKNTFATLITFSRVLGLIRSVVG